VQVSLGQLRDARDVLVRAGDQPPVLPAEMTTVAWALRRGCPHRWSSASSPRWRDRRGRPPCIAVADLVAHRFDPDSAAGLIIEAVRDGVPRERLLDVSGAVLQQVQRGHTRAEALASVRRELPNLPAPRSRRAATSPVRAARRRQRRRKRWCSSVEQCRRDVAGPARVSTVKRARVARVIPPGGIET